MKLINITLALAAGLALSAAAPTTSSVTALGIADRQAPSQGLIEVATNGSLLFGWQLAGAALNDAQLTAACADLASVGNSQWEQIGLVPSAIVAPICASQHAPPNPVGNKPKVQYYNTEIFITQILNSFSPANTARALEYLCCNLQPTMLEPFDLLPNRIRAAVCANSHSGESMPLMAIPPTPVPAPAVTAFFNAISDIFAYEFMASATSNAQVKDYCQVSSQYAAHLTDEGLNFAIIQLVICLQGSSGGYLTPPDSLHYVVQWSSQVFYLIVEHAASVPGWLQWLCTNLDAGAMTAVGLDGSGVTQSICTDAGAA